MMSVLTPEIPASNYSDSWSRVERLFAASFFPAALFASVFAYDYLVSSGRQPFETYVYCAVPVIVLVVFFERIFPNNKVWNKSHGDILTDLGHYITIAISGAAIRPLMVLGALWVAGSLLPESGIWPHDWPFLIQLALVMVILEAVTYWVHRLQHQIPVLWRFHCIHHSARRLYWLNTVRFHFVDILMNSLPGVGLLILLDVNEKTLMAALLVTAVVGVFQHGNLKTRIGPLNWIFSMAELHRWHHSKVAAESNTNYGQSIILWDIVFGTRFLPEDREQPQVIGMEHPDPFPDNFWAQLVAPVHWRY